MLSPIPDRLFKQVGSGFLCWAVFGAAAAALAPVLIPLYLVACAFIAWRSVRVAYITERFIEFSSLAMFNWLAVCPLLGLAIGLSLFQRLIGMDTLHAVALSLMPAVMSFIGYQLMKKLGKKSPFTVCDGIVKYARGNKSDGISMIVGGVGSALGATGLSYLTVQNQAQAAFGLYLFFFLVGLYYVFFLRHAIFGIQELKRIEQQSGVPLRPESIQSIRLVRNQSWLGRRLRDAGWAEDTD